MNVASFLNGIIRKRIRIHTIRTIHYILIVLTIIEISCHGVLNHALNPYINSIVYFICGLSIPILIWRELATTNLQSGITNYNVYPYGKWGIALLLLLLTQHYTELLIEARPLDYTHADMLPIIEIMSERFIQNENVYSIIPEIWGGMQPIYLPAMWLPFTIPKLLAIDIRWATWTIILLGTLTILRPWSKQSGLVTSWSILASIVLYTWITILQIDSGMLALTEEGIVIGYYLLLCLALYHKNGWFIGIAAGCCLMSRYALLPWWLVISVVGFLLGNRSTIYKMAASSILTCLILMTAGQAWGSIDVFLSVPDNYLTAILENQDKYEGMINSNLGIAKFWNYNSLGSLHQLLKLTSIIAPTICAIIHYRSRKLGWSIFSIITLKISLVLFYNLLIMPYTYLFYTSTALSVFLLSITLPMVKKEIILPSSKI